MLKTLALAGVVAGYSFAASAAVVISESTDFDDSSSFFPGASTIGTLALGETTVQGNLSGTCASRDCNGASAGDTQDSFLFTVAAGQELVGGSVSSAVNTGLSGLTYSVSLRGPSTPGSLEFETFSAAGGGTFLGSPLAAGQYSLSVFGQSADEDGAYDLDWTVSLTTRETADGVVPLPASLPLLFGAVAALGLARRRTA